MTTPEPMNNTDETLPPLIPSWLLLGISGAGIIVALAALSLSGINNEIGIGALAIAVISLVAWAAMNPKDLMNFFTGRSTLYGGTAIVITFLMIVAAVLIYSTVEGLNLRADMSDSDIYSLRDETRDLITTITNDPTIPPLRIIGFTTAAFAGERDRVEVLLNDFQTASDGKISYEFIDINRNPYVLDQYGENLTVGQYAVVPVDPETDETRPDQAQVVQGFNQYALTNALITASASGDFQLHVLTVNNGVSIEDTTQVGASGFADELFDRFKWGVAALNPLFLTGDTPQVILGDAGTDGEVLLIPGGDTPLVDEVVTPITNFVDNGGDLVVLGGVNPTGEPALATADNLSNYLWENFGVRMRNDIVIDPDNIVLNEFLFTDFAPNHPITQGFPAGIGIAMQGHSVEVAPTLPENVTVTVLLSTGVNAYSKENLDLINATNETLQPTADDLSGVLTLAVAVENTATGARVVLVGGDNLLYNNYRVYADIANVEFARQSVFWAGQYEDFVGALATIANIPTDGEQPLLLTAADINMASFIALGVVPFGLLIAGGLSYWLRRERQAA